MSKEKISNLIEKLDKSIKTWYLKEYPADEVGKTLSPDVTFLNLNNLLNSGKGDVYSLLGGEADTIIRERCFEKLCELTDQDYDSVYNKWLNGSHVKKDIPKLLYEINLKKFRENFECGDLAMLEYLKGCITPDLEDLYNEILEYNEIYANGWTIQELFQMGEKDSYWIERAKNFIKKHNVPKENYNEYTNYYEEYCELRNELLDELGLFDYLDNDLSVDKIPEHGFLDGDTLTKVSEIVSGNSYTVARIMNYCNCVELHYYPEGKAEVEYGYKHTHDCWESDIEEAEWFNLSMTDNEVSEKLYDLFKEEFGIEKENLIEEDIEREM